MTIHDGEQPKIDTMAGDPEESGVATLPVDLLRDEIRTPASTQKFRDIDDRQRSGHVAIMGARWFGSASDGLACSGPYGLSWAHTSETTSLQTLRLIVASALIRAAADVGGIRSAHGTAVSSWEASRISRSSPA